MCLQKKRFSTNIHKFKHDLVSLKLSIIVLFTAYLEHRDVNVIILDWWRLALSNYVTAVLGVPAVGRGLGQFLKFIKQVTRQDYSKMHLVGFSLGAHIVGNAGKELNGTIARITGKLSLMLIRAVMVFIKR